MSSAEMTKHIVDIKKKHDLRGGAIHQVISGRKEIERLRGVIPESNFKAITEEYENPDVKGVHLPYSHVIILFSERIDAYAEGVEIWSHEQAHEFFDTLPKEDQERFGKMCLDWLRFNNQNAYQKVIDKYNHDDRHTEACAYLISEVVKEYVLDIFMGADFGGNIEIAKFADAYRKFLKDERQERRETQGDRFRQSEIHKTDIELGGRDNQGREIEPKERRAEQNGGLRNGITPDSNKSVTIDLPLATRRKVKSVMGRDYDSHNIDANGMVHAKKNHGVGGKKIDGKSIPLRDDDFKLAPYIMIAPDEVERGSMGADGRESIRFKKRLSNGVVLVVEKEQKNSPDDMDTINMWANKSSRVADARFSERPLHSTSKPVNNTQGANSLKSNTVTVITSFDAAKIRKDAETAIKKMKKSRPTVVSNSSAPPPVRHTVSLIKGRYTLTRRLRVPTRLYMSTPICGVRLSDRGTRNCGAKL